MAGITVFLKNRYMHLMEYTLPCIEDGAQVADARIGAFAHVGARAEIKTGYHHAACDHGADAGYKWELFASSGRSIGERVRWVTSHHSRKLYRADSCFVTRNRECRDRRAGRLTRRTRKSFELIRWDDLDVPRSAPARHRSGND